MLGAIYGGASLYFSAPTFYGPDTSEWSPSWVWLPSYLAFKCGFGIRHSVHGYAFVGRLGRATYGSVSILLGMLILGGGGWILGEALRKMVIRARK